MDVLNYKNIFKLVLLDKYKILILFVIFASVSVFYALSLPNIYTSRIVVSSTINEGGKLSGSLGGLASMAGISLGGGEMSPEVVKESLVSNSFLGNFVKENNLGSILFAAESFDPSTKKFVFDESIYDSNLGEWTREVKYPQEVIPAIDELAKKLKESLVVGYDRKTKLITVTLSSYSPDFAKETLTLLISDFNMFMKNKEKEEAELTIKYLKDKLNREQVSEIRLALQQLLEEQLKKLALAETKTEYALKVIDNPLRASQKSSPRRSIICLAITLFGTAFCTLLLLTFRIARLER
ncbi:Wzz/FepE/Etk N-terminal domain-containing protein [Pseudoalteromonas shioyasakiensis]|uniref:Wzz/FepE/Etk N-terminal domain-containing protein n=1 Tax=Pseudoalteromonas shioyasakiensis TaxID=1190813 RepID=UPI0024A65277|nr:Wzz/FepE/Etk N-terminal domain-containing protein [Pseudoalteromonas shioyasakiensis]MDI4652067.1 Wzz/FepE/Etk N-terminal domain-containing protein [Pseudoalteromonas shioyasakiensis]